MSDVATVDQLVDAISEAMPPLNTKQLELVLSTYRAMLAGTPADVTAIAAGAHWPTDEAASQLREWPGVYFDDQGSVIGFWGLTVAPISTHLVTTKAGSSWAWCALDPLFILPLVQESGTVATRSGITGKPVELQVNRDGVKPIAAQGDEVYVSFVTPTGPFTSDVRLTFCDYVHYFDSRQSADRWTSQHPGTIALPLNEAAAIGRHQAERLRQDASSTAA